MKEFNLRLHEVGRERFNDWCYTILTELDQTEITAKIRDGLSNQLDAVVKPANGGQIYLLYKRLLGYSDMTPVLVAVFDDVEKALDQKYRLQKDDHANSYFIEDSRLSV